MRRQKLVLGLERYDSVLYLSMLGEDVLRKLASFSEKHRRLYAPGENICEKRTLCLIINESKVWPFYHIFSSLPT